MQMQMQTQMQTLSVNRPINLHYPYLATSVHCKRPVARLTKSVNCPQLSNAL